MLAVAETGLHRGYVKLHERITRHNVTAVVQPRQLIHSSALSLQFELSPYVTPIFLQYRPNLHGENPQFFVFVQLTLETVLEVFL